MRALAWQSRQTHENDELNINTESKYGLPRHFVPRSDGKAKVAFTLAEVLITLVVIGVVAAITVPMLHANYKKQETISKLKKGYSILSQAIRRSELDNGPVSTWVFPDERTVDGNDTQFFKTYIEPYIKTVKKYGYSVNKIHHNVQNIDGQHAETVHSWNILQDGSSIGTYLNRPEGHVWIFYDINNSNKPNRLGKDIFVFTLFEVNQIGSKFNVYRNFRFLGLNRNEPQNDSGGGMFMCKKATGGTYAGMYCGAWIMKNNWEIPEGYPW